MEALLSASSAGDSAARGRLIELLYDELRVLARRHRWRWGDAGAPGTTSIVHEVYVNLSGRHPAQWSDKSDFFRFASVVMRNLLVDQARALSRLKRNSSNATATPQRGNFEEILSLNDALDRLAQTDPRSVRVVEHRFFGGLTVEETATAMDLSPATVKRSWDAARAWLYVDLHGEEPLA